MATSLKDTTRTSELTGLVNAINSGSPPAHLIVYTGTAPLKTAAPTGSPLATWTLANPPGTVSGGVLTMAFSATSVTASNGGTPGYYRIIDGATDDGTHTQIQGSAGVGSGDINFSSTIAAGGTATISSLVYTEGNG